MGTHIKPVIYYIYIFGRSGIIVCFRHLLPIQQFLCIMKKKTEVNKDVKKSGVVSFLSQKGGVGKSSLTLLLAFGLARLKIGKVGIVDTDLIQGSVLHFFMSRRKSAEARGVELDDGISVSLGENKKLSSYIVENGYTLFDTPGKASVQTLSVAQLSTHIFVPINGSLSTVRPQVALINEFYKQKGRFSKFPKISLVYTLTVESSNLDDVENFIQHNLDVPVNILKHSLPFRAAYEGAYNYGKSFTEVSFPTLRERAMLLEKEMVDFVVS